MKIKRLFTILTLATAASICFVSCDTENDPAKEDIVNDDPDNPSDPDNPTDPTDPGDNPSQQQKLDCFVYYKDATFLYIYTSYDNKKTKLFWQVNDYDKTTCVASITQTMLCDTGNETSEFKLKKESDGSISYSQDGTAWTSRTNQSKEWNFMFISKASRPSGCFGNIMNKVQISDVTGPDGKSAQGYIVSSDYDNSREDYYMYDDISHESWSPECGLAQSFKHISNMQSYPTYTYQADYKLVAYYIPMPDGTVRSYSPDEPAMKAVTNLSAHSSDLRNTSSKCSMITFIWNDFANTNVFKYNLYNMYQDPSDGNWYRQKVFSDNEAELGSWFIGVADCEDINHKDNLRGTYSTRSGSGLSFPEGYYFFYVTAESLSFETSFDDITEIIGIQLGVNWSESTTHSITHNTAPTRSVQSTLPTGQKIPGAGEPVPLK